MDPKVFYGPLKERAVRPPDSDTETDIEDRPKKFKRLHRRTDSERDVRKRPKDDMPVDVTSRAGQRELIRRASIGDLTYIGQGLQIGWQPTPEAVVSAARGGHAEVLGMLLAFGSGDVNHNGVTPLAVAITENHVQVARLLVDANVSLSYRDSHGRSYSDLADKADVPMKKIIHEAYAARKERRERKERRRSEERSGKQPGTTDGDRPQLKKRLSKDKREFERSTKGAVKEHVKEKLKSKSVNIVPRDHHESSKSSSQKLLNDISEPRIARDHKLVKDVHGDGNDTTNGPLDKPHERKLSTASQSLDAASSSNKEAEPKNSKDPKDGGEQTEKEAERPRRKTFSLSDYKNLKFTKAKKEAEEKEKQQRLEEEARQKDIERAERARKEVQDAADNAERQSAKEAEEAESRASAAKEAAAKEAAAIKEAKEAEALAKEAASRKAAELAAQEAEKLEEASKEIAAADATNGDTSADQSVPMEIDEFVQGSRDKKSKVLDTRLDVASSTKAVPSPDTAKESPKHSPRDGLRVTFKDPESEGDSMESPQYGPGSKRGSTQIPNESAIESPDSNNSPLSRNVREMSHSPHSRAPAQFPNHQPDHERHVKRTEERKAMEALLAKRDRERKAREAQMLEKLASSEKRRKSEKNQSPISPVVAQLPKEEVQEPVVVPSTTSATSSVGSAGSPLVKHATQSEELLKLPYILRRLACLGKPQPQTGPLFVHRFTGTGGSFAADPAKFHGLDLQLGALFGINLHAKYPDLAKVLVNEADKGGLWEFVSPWVCRNGCGPAEREEEFAKFMEFPTYWIRGDDIVNIGKELEMEYKTIPIALHTPNGQAVDSVLLELTKSLPIGLAARNCLRQQVYAWD